jgi:hypothetical protein
MSCEVIDVIGLFLSVEMGGDGVPDAFSDCVGDYGAALPTRGDVRTGVLAEMVGSEGS